MGDAYRFNEAEIRKAITILKPDGRDFEIRMVAGKKWNCAGIFRDADSLIEAIKTGHFRPNANTYITLNRLDDACYGRSHHNQFIEYQTPTISDNDVVGYDWLLIDVDPKRPADTSSTKEQVAGSQEKAKRIRDYLRDRGWSEPVIAHSGNGTHLLYSIALKPDRKELIQQVLQTLDMLFTDDAMDIDQTTFNPSRICKLYGTWANKGADIEERPHRMARILYVPDKIEVTPAAYLEELVQILPKQDAPQQYNNYAPATFDLQSWIDQHGIEVTSVESWHGGKKWILDHCPFNPEHNHKDAALFQATNGAPGFSCFHSSCADKHWHEFRLFYEPDAYSKQNPAVPNYMATKPESFGKQTATAPLFVPDFSPQEQKPDGPVFRTTEEIRSMVVPDEAHILTGIAGIDSRMIGLKKGYVTVLSGLRSAGKSSILSQLVIQCREQGMKCALFSGEMNSKQVLRWLTLQAAGKAHVHSTQYENVFYPNEGASEKVSQWLNEFVYVYNNDYGNGYSTLLTNLAEIVQTKQLDMVLLDNLMALNIEELDRDLYVRQTKFLRSLKGMADKLNIHVVLVAHPRKSQGYLRMDDISGSGDITNAADNVLIIHRVDEDYKKATQQFFSWKKDNPIYQASNVIEICKDRDWGNRDIYVPLYFEKQTKRLRNSDTEYKHYGWETGYVPGAEDFIPVDVPEEELPW